MRSLEKFEILAKEELKINNKGICYVKKIIFNTKIFDISKLCRTIKPL